MFAVRGTGAISNPDPAILCGGLLRLWETPAKFARKSVHLDPVLRSTFINRYYCRQTWIIVIMLLFKLITTLILTVKRTLARVLNCCNILVVIYFNLFKLITVNHGFIFVSNADFDILNITSNGLSWPYMVNAALLLFYSFVIGIISE